MEPCSRASLVFCAIGILCYLGVFATPVSAATPGWYPGPKFNISANNQSVNTFVGQVLPTNKNQLRGNISFLEVAKPTDAQNFVIKDVTFQYGPENKLQPVDVGAYGPGNITYLQDPMLEGPIATGLNLQLNARAGYHFVNVSFGLAMNAAPGPFYDAFFVDGLGSSTVGSGSITIKSLVWFAEGKFVATNIYTPQITIVPNTNITAQRFAVDNIQYVLEHN